MRKHLVLAVLIAAVCIAAVPAVAAERVIGSGIDIWSTRPDGTTHYDFADNAIPAGFFCANSEPFTGMIYLKGSPIATGVPGALGNADTIVERLDDAVFTKSGVATTRIQMRALSLVSMAPIKTSCGLFNAKVTLDGDQPTTVMRIVRETRDGGSYIAPLAFNAKIEFTPVEGRFVRPRVLRKSIQFMAKPNATWTSRPPAELVAHEGFVKVDTDGDGAPDSFLEGTSNFSAAGNPAAKAVNAGCHCADTICSKQHCPTGVYPVTTTQQQQQQQQTQN